MKLNNVNHFTCSRQILKPQDNTTTSLEKFDLEFQKACEEKNYDKLIELSEKHISQIHLETINECLFNALKHDENDLVEFLLTKKIADIYACKPNDKNSILHIACRLGNTRIVKLLLSMGANIETLGHSNLTPLLHAIYNGSSDIVQMLIDNNADTSSSDVINHAFHAQNPEAVRILLNKRMSLNNPLGESRYFLFEDLCTYPISKRSAQNETSDVMRDPTTISAESRNKLLNILKENDLLHFDPISIETEKALLVACSVDYDDVFECLHQNGFNFSKLPEKIASDLFYKAIKNKSHKVLNKLIKLGLDVNCQDDKKYTPLHSACICNDHDAIRILLNANAKKDIPEFLNCTSFDFALHYVDNEEIIQEFMQDESVFESFKLSSKSAFHPSSKNLKILLDSDFFHDNPLELLVFLNDFEEKGPNPYLPLFLEALRKYPEYKDLLIDMGNSELALALSKKEFSLQFRIACSDKDYTTLEHLAEDHILEIPTETINVCLFEALEKNEDDLVEFLLLNSLVEVNAKKPFTKNEKKEFEPNSENSILHVACRNGNMKIARLLLDLGADIEAIGKGKVTPLVSAIFSGSIDMVKFLIDNNANMQASMLLEAAFAAQNPQALHLLLEHGASLNTPLENKDNSYLLMLCAYPLLKKEEYKEKGMCSPDPLTIGVDSRRKLLDILKADGKLQFDHSSDEFILALITIGRSKYEDVLNYLLNDCFDILSLPDEALKHFFKSIIKSKLNHVLEKMIALGFDVNHQFEDKNSLLHMACKSNNKGAIKLLLQAQVKKNIANNNGLTPFDLALCKVKDPAIIKEFMEDKSVLESFKLQQTEPSLKNIKILLDSPFFDKNPMDFIICLAYRANSSELGQEYCALLTQSLKKYPEYIHNPGTDILFEETIRSGNLELVKEFSEKGIQLPAGDNTARTPLHWACIARNIDLVQWLLDAHKLDINKKDVYGNTILHNNIEEDTDPKFIDFLVERGFNFFETNNVGNTIFELTLRKTDVGVDLLEKLLSLDSEKRFLKTGQRLGRSPLHYVAKAFNFSAMKFLLEKHNLDVNVQDDLGRTPLMVLLRIPHDENRFKKGISLLLNHGADLKLKDIRGRTILHCIFNEKPHNKEVQELLIQKQPMLLLNKDKSEVTPLHLACRKHDKERVAELFTIAEKECGIFDLSSLVDDEGKNFLHYAAENEDLELFEFLLEKGLDFRTETTYFEQPIHIAIRNERTPLVLRLLELGADPTACLKDGTSCLDIAIMKKQKELYSALIGRGALLFRSKASHTLPGSFWQKQIPQEIQDIYLQKAIKTSELSCSDEEIRANPEVLLNLLPPEKVLEFLWLAQNPILVSKVIPLVSSKGFEEAFTKFSSEIQFESLRDYFIFDEIDPAHFEIEVPSRNIPDWTDDSVTIQDLTTIITSLNFKDKNHPNYIDPSLLTLHGKTYTPKELKKSFKKTFIHRIANEEEFTLTGAKGSPEIKQFYQQLKNKVLPLVAKLKSLGTSQEDKELKMKILLTILPELSLCGPKWQTITKEAYVLFVLEKPVDYKLSVLETLQTQRDTIVENLVDPSNQHNVHEAVAFTQAFGKELGLQKATFKDEMAEDTELKKEELLHRFFKAYTVDAVVEMCYLEAKDKPGNIYNEIIDVLFQTPAGYMQIPEGIDDEIAYMMSVWQEEGDEDVVIDDKTHIKRVYFKRETIAKVLEQYGIIRRIRPRE